MKSPLAVFASIGFAAAGGGCWALWPNVWGVPIGLVLILVAIALIATRDAEFEDEIEHLTQEIYRSGP